MACINTGEQSVLQNIENFYLAILRVVVIGVAGLLLAAVVYFGLNSIGATSPAPAEVPTNPQVSSEAFKKALMGEAGISNTTTDTVRPPEGNSGIREEYVKVANILDEYYAKELSYSGGLNEGALAEWYSQSGEIFSTEELNQAFAAGFLARVTEVVADENFRKWMVIKEPEDALSEIISVYKADFDKQVEEARAANEEAQIEHAAKKAESLQMLYVAGAAFLAFLLIVFLSIIIRIERNLRPQPQA